MEENNYREDVKRQKNGTNLSFTFGLLGLILPLALTCCLPFVSAVVGLCFSIAAIPIGVVAFVRSNAGEMRALAGAILGFIGMYISAICLCIGLYLGSFYFVYGFAFIFKFLFALLYLI